jgi:hypothetical protein
VTSVKIKVKIKVKSKGQAGLALEGSGCVAREAGP